MHLAGIFKSNDSKGRINFLQHKKQGHFIKIISGTCMFYYYIKCESVVAIASLSEFQFCEDFPNSAYWVSHGS